MNKLLVRMLQILGALIVLGTLPLIDIWVDVTGLIYGLYYGIVVIFVIIILIFYFRGKLKKAQEPEKKQIIVTPDEAKDKFIEKLKNDPDDPEELYDIEYRQITSGNPNNPTSIGFVFGKGYYTDDYYYYFINLENPKIDTIIKKKGERKLKQEEILEIANSMSSKPQAKHQEVVRRYSDTGELIAESVREISEETPEKPETSKEGEIAEEGETKKNG